MTPLLVALTGPARHEVARVLRAGCPGADPVAGASAEPWWGEVRDYLSLPASLASAASSEPLAALWKQVEAAGHNWLPMLRVEAFLRKQVPGGPEFLADQVLPVNPRQSLSSGRGWVEAWNEGPHFNHWSLARSVLNRTGQPRRLAIECRAEDTFLLERVAAWGGQRWECCGPELDMDGNQCDPDEFGHYIDQFGRVLCDGYPTDCSRQPLSHHGNTWLEVVQSALECPPC